MVINYVNSAFGKLQTVLLCSPKYLRLAPINKIALNYLNQGIQLDIQKCIDEHQQLVQFYLDNGIEVELSEASEGLSSQVFSRDFAFNLKEGVVLGRFKEEVRWPEIAAYEQQLKRLGIPVIAHCKEGVFEGGDCWLIDDKTIAVGCLQRSNELGINSVSKQLKALGYEVIAVPAHADYLHLDMIFNIVGYKTAVTCYEVLPESFRNKLHMLGFDLIKIPESGILKHQCNVQSLGEQRVISLKSNHLVNTELRMRGYKVFELDCSEILKAGGGPHCMTFPLFRE